MELTATGSIYELLAEEYPGGCTGEQAQEFMRRVGHSCGSPAAGLRGMGSNLTGGLGGGMVKHTASKGQRIKSGQRRPKGLNK